MSKGALELTPLIGDKAAFATFWKEQTGDNSRSVAEMKHMMYRMIRSELTGQQRTCLMMLIKDGKKQIEIAHALGLNPSTVSRHLAAARKKLLRYAGLFFDRP